MEEERYSPTYRAHMEAAEASYLSHPQDLVFEFSDRLRDAIEARGFANDTRLTAEVEWLTSRLEEFVDYLVAVDNKSHSSWRPDSFADRFQRAAESAPAKAP